MGCHKHTARCPGIHPCCQKHLREMLLYVHLTLSYIQVPHWLNFGTLLGAVREGDLIPWDEDIDVGVWETDVDKIIKNSALFTTSGYRLKVNRISNGVVCSVAVFYSETNSLHTCLNTFTLDSSGKYGCGVEWPGMRFPIENLHTLGSASIRSIEYPVPQHPETGLEGFYGGDWRTPMVKKWMKNLCSDKALDPQLRKLFQELPEYDYEPGRNL